MRFSVEYSVLLTPEMTQRAVKREIFEFDNEGTVAFQQYQLNLPNTCDKRVPAAAAGAGMGR